MRVSKRQLRRIIREEANRLREARQEPYEGYLKDECEDYVAGWEAGEVTHDDWLEFAGKYGVSWEDADDMWDDCQTARKIEGGFPELESEEWRRRSSARVFGR